VDFGGQARIELLRAGDDADQGKTKESESFPAIPKVGLEPTPPCGDRILSPARLPFRHFGSFDRSDPIAIYASCEARARVIALPENNGVSIVIYEKTLPL
jgi:hypothetical protein